MSAEKWFALPEGTKVRMTCDYDGFMKWQIVTRMHTKPDDSDTVYFVDYNTDDYGNYLSDYQWELIEEPIQNTKLPDQWKIVFVKDSENDEYDYNDPRICICIYNERIIVESWDGGVSIYDDFYFPKIITLDDEDFYIIEKDGQKILQPVYPAPVIPKDFDLDVDIGERY